jgi:hypothetical protein
MSITFNVPSALETSFARGDDYRVVPLNVAMNFTAIESRNWVELLVYSSFPPGMSPCEMCI